MLKPGFGLKDAPRLWLMALKRVLSKIGVSATQVDQQLFCMHRNRVLVLLMTIHVDDIKLCGDPAVMTVSIFTGSFFACGISLPLCFIIAQVPKQKKNTWNPLLPN